MQYLRLHGKVHLWWNRWCAIQRTDGLPETSGGYHLEWRRPLLDLHIHNHIISIGRHPVLTDPRTKYCHSGRGFLYADSDEAKALGLDRVYYGPRLDEAYEAMIL